MQSVVLDACVLFRGKLTDFLLCLAEQGVFEPVWSDGIHDEWMRNVHAKHGIPLDRLEYRRSEMEKAFPVANHPADSRVLTEVTALCRTDAGRKDAHVIATAIVAQAVVILTDNVADFHHETLDSYGLTAMKPDRFCRERFHGYSSLVISAARTHRQGMTKPGYSREAYLDLLSGPKLGLPGLANLLLPHKYLL